MQSIHANHRFCTSFSGQTLSGYIPGSLLRTKVEKLDGSPVGRLVFELCQNFSVSHEFVVTRSLAIALNQLLNRNSKLRKPPPLPWC